MSYRGVDLSGNTYGLRVEQSAIPVRPSADTCVVQFAGGGGAHGVTRVGVREISVNVLVSGTSQSDLLSKIDALNALLDWSSDWPLVFDHIPDRYWNVRPSGDQISVPPLGTSSMKFRLVFVATDPYAYSTTESIVSLNDNDSDGVITTTITPGGSADAEPEYVLTAPPSTAMMISNATTGKTIYLAYQNPAHLVKVDTRFMALYPVYVSGDGGETWTPAPEIISGDYYNMQLVRGAANALTIWAGSATITYRARYL